MSTPATTPTSPITIDSLQVGDKVVLTANFIREAEEATVTKKGRLYVTVERCSHPIRIRVGTAFPCKSVPHDRTGQTYTIYRTREDYDAHVFVSRAFNIMAGDARKWLDGGRMPNLTIDRIEHVRQTLRALHKGEPMPDPKGI